LGIKLIILDFDGVIVDSNYSKQLSLNNFCLKKYNIYLPSKKNLYDLRNLDRYQQCEIAKGSKITLEEKKELDAFIESSYMNLKLDPFLHQFYKLCKSKKIFIALVSSTPHRSLINVIKNLSIDYYFDSIYGRLDNLNKNFYFRKLIEEFNLVPNNVISVGDHINDFLYSRECNINFYSFRNFSFSICNNNFGQLDNLYDLSKKIGLLKK